MFGAPSNRRSYTQPRHSLYADLTPERVALMIRQADGGDFRPMAQLVKTIRAQTRVQSALGFRVGAIQALKLEVEHPDETVRSALVGDAARQEGDIWQILPEDQLYDLLSWGWIAGFALVEFDWTYDWRTGRWVPKLEVWDLEHLRWSWANRCWLLRVSPANGAFGFFGYQEIQIQPGDDKWWLFTPYGRVKPWQRGIWRGLADTFLLGTYGRTDLGRYSELHGQGFKKVTVPPGTSRERKIEIVSEMDALATEPTVVLERGRGEDPGEVLELVEAQGRTWEVFKYELEYADREARNAILGFDLDGAGSFAASKVREQLFESGVTARDISTLSTKLQQGPLLWYDRYNFASDFAPFLRWVKEKDRAATQSQQADAHRKLAEAAKALRQEAEASGLRFDAMAYFEAVAPDLPIEVKPPFPTTPAAVQDEEPSNGPVYTPPGPVASNAALGLYLHNEHPGRVDATHVNRGTARARQLSNQKPLSLGTMRALSVWFLAHVDADEQSAIAGKWGDKTDPSGMWIEWLWNGGDEGREWIEQELAKLDSPEDATPPVSALGLEPLNRTRHRYERRPDGSMECLMCGLVRGRSDGQLELSFHDKHGTILEGEPETCIRDDQAQGRLIHAMLGMVAEQPRGPAQLADALNALARPTVLDVSGVQVNIEHWCGDVRFPGCMPLTACYGDILGTMGADGDPVDAWVGPVTTAPMAFVIWQMEPETGAFDELKVVLGVLDRERAVQLYLKNTGGDVRRFGQLEPVPASELLAWLNAFRVPTQEDAS